MDIYEELTFYAQNSRLLNVTEWNHPLQIHDKKTIVAT